VLDYNPECVWGRVEVCRAEHDAFNAGLSVCSRLTVDYTRGELVFRWAAGAVSEVMYTSAWSRKRGNLPVSWTYHVAK